MLETIAVILLILWLIGAIAVPIGSSLIHALLVIALVLLAIRLIQGRNVL